MGCPVIASLRIWQLRKKFKGRCADIWNKNILRVQAFFSISCKANLCVTNSLNLCLTENVFYLHFWRIALLYIEFWNGIFSAIWIYCPTDLKPSLFLKSCFLLQLSRFSLFPLTVEFDVLYVDLFIFILCFTFCICRLFFNQNWDICNHYVLE